MNDRGADAHRIVTDAAPSSADRARVQHLLGREPQGAYRIVVRRADGDPVVLLNMPVLDDGTPMPTRYWLVGDRETREISRLESSGGVRRAEGQIPREQIADAHRRYAIERDAVIPTDHAGPRPSGGVAGTRIGVKCLHAHYAWHLAGGDDPVGRWVAAELEGDVITRDAISAGTSAGTSASTAHPVDTVAGTPRSRSRGGAA